MPEKPEKPKKPKKLRDPLDMTRLTPTQRAQIERVAQTGARLGLSQQRVPQAALTAIRETFDAMIETYEGEEFARVIFSALGQIATASNAKRIAQHRLCPPGVAEEIAARLAALSVKDTMPVEPKLGLAPKKEVGGDRPE